MASPRRPETARVTGTSGKPNGVRRRVHFPLLPGEAGNAACPVSPCGGGRYRDRIADCPPLAAVPGVSQAVAALRRDLPGGDGIAAYLLPAPGASVPGLAALREQLAQTPPAYMIPAA